MDQDMNQTTTNQTQIGHSVEIYSTPTCHFCHMAKEFFDNHNIKYIDHDVLADTVKRQEMVEKSGQLGVPVIIINGNVTVGFDEPKISGLLGINT